MTRDYYFDNAKFILIFLVVLGHYCGNYLNSKFLLGMYDAIYSFHMPLFIFISGYFSRNIKQQRFKDVDTILLPYLIIQVVYILYKHLLGISQPWTFVYPIDANWFLLGLFIWRLVIPYFNYIKHPVIISVVIALSIGFSNEVNNYLDLQRILTFLPFFVMGYFFPGDFKQSVLKMKSKLLPFLAFSVIVIMFFVIAMYFPGKESFIRKCFIPSMSYNIWFGQHGEYGIFFRIFSFGASIVISYLFVQLIPDRKTWYSELGQRTLYVFLFHLILLYLVGKYVRYIPVYTELLAIPISAFITLILSNKFLDVVLEKILTIHHFRLSKSNFHLPHIRF